MKHGPLLFLFPVLLQPGLCAPLIAMSIKHYLPILCSQHVCLCLVYPPVQCPHYSVCLYATVYRSGLCASPPTAFLICLLQESLPFILPFIPFPGCKQIADDVCDIVFLITAGLPSCLKAKTVN